MDPICSSSDILVRYNNPTIVTRHIDSKTLSDNKELRKDTLSFAEISDSKGNEEILNSILPPKCWEEDGHLWTQTVSSTPGTRQDVINLQKMLDTRLQQTQARETGICPIRRELYSQCFDELIRQVTINCMERGLLLLRVRDELSMSIQSYETLYCSSVAFGLRKALQAQEEKETLRNKVESLENEKGVLEESIDDLKIRTEQSERRNSELRAADEKKFSEEIAFLKKTNSQLKAQLEGITVPKKLT